ncbi:hypothetical protein EV715DRAFT_250490 [Schizophyllum commune]
MGLSPPRSTHDRSLSRQPQTRSVQSPRGSMTMENKCRPRASRGRLRNAPGAPRQAYRWRSGARGRAGVRRCGASGAPSGLALRPWRPSAPRKGRSSVRRACRCASRTTIHGRVVGIIGNQNSDVHYTTHPGPIRTQPSMGSFCCEFQSGDALRLGEEGAHLEEVSAAVEVGRSTLCT